MPILEVAGGRCAVLQQEGGTHGIHERGLADLVRSVQDVETVLEGDFGRADSGKVPYGDLPDPHR